MLNPFCNSFVGNLKRHGFAVIPDVLSTFAMANLFHEVEKGLHWQIAEKEVGQHRTRQDYEFVGGFPPESSFRRVARELQARLNEGFAQTDASALPEPMAFSDVRLQRYPVGSRGIDPHLDGHCCRYLVAILVLKAGGLYCICTDRSGRDFVPIKSQAGDMILMRSNGLWDRNVQPFHFVPKIEDAPRMTLGLRMVRPN